MYTYEITVKFNIPHLVGKQIMYLSFFFFPSFLFEFLLMRFTLLN